MQELSQGTRLVERYALIKKIGEGGMAELWLARDDRADATVTLKFLKASLLETAGQRELFRKEWQVSSRLMHAHIARVFEYHDEARPFYAMQHIDGPDIGDLGGQPLESFLPALGFVADALRYAHGKDVIHRDVKGSNVMLDSRGAPYLIDFGISAAMTGGSAANASPQQRSGSAPQPADDVYALGVLAYELIAGRPPGDGDMRELQTASGEPVPGAVAALLMDMLRENPDSRPTAEQVHERLAEAGFPAAPARLSAAQRQTAPIAETDSVQVASYSRRRPGQAEPTAPSEDSGGGLSAKTVYTALAILVLLLIGVTVILPNAVDREDEPTVAEEPAPDEDGGESDAAVADVPETSEAETELDGAADSIEAKAAADDALGDLLSVLDGLKFRGVERWGDRKSVV